MVNISGSNVRAFIYDEYMDGGEMYYPDPDLCEEGGQVTMAALASFYAHLAKQDKEGILTAISEVSPFYEISRNKGGEPVYGDYIYCGDIVLCSWKLGNRYEYGQYVIDYDIPSGMHWAREIGANAIMAFATPQIQGLIENPAKTLYEMQVIGNTYEQKMLLVDEGDF